MRVRKSQGAWAVVAIAAVLVLAGSLLASRGFVEALGMVVVAAVLAGMYMLRRYARAELLYRRPTELHRRHPEGEPSSSAPAGPAEGPFTGADAASISRPGRRA